MTRYFVRLPAFESTDEALDHVDTIDACAAPVLHAQASAPVVGSVEVRGEVRE